MALPPRFSVKSDDAFERGRQLGAQAAEYVRGSVEVYQQTFDYYTGLPWSEIRRLAGAFRAPIEAYDAEIMREMDGIAEGAAVTPEDVLAVNVRTEVMFGLSARTPPPECTTFYVGPRASADGHVLVGQNWDWRTRCGETMIMAEIDQGADRPSILTIAEGGLVAKMGFNSAGIAVATNALVSGEEGGAPAVPFHVLLRGILNSSTLEQAVSAVLRARRAASGNFVIACASGRAVNIESGPGGVEAAFLTHPEDDLIGHANNFVCDVPFADVGAEKWPDTLIRDNVVGTSLRKSHGSISKATIKAILADHTNYPDAICRHPNEEHHPIEQDATNAAMIVDLTEMLAEIAVGRPCESEFSSYSPSFSAMAEPLV